MGLMVSIHPVGKRYVYKSVISPEKTKRSAMDHLVQTDFLNHQLQMVLKLSDISSVILSETDLFEIGAWIEEAKSETG